MFQRSERVSSLIHSELSKIILKEIEFSPGVLITVTSVEIDKKMDRAMVGITVLPGDIAEKVLGVLEIRAGYLQHLLLKKVNIKPMPRLMFCLDKGFENAAKIEKLLKDK